MEKFFVKFTKKTSYFLKSFISRVSTYIMASLGQKLGSCGCVIAAFDLYSKYARCHDKGLSNDPWGRFQKRT